MKKKLKNIIVILIGNAFAAFAISTFVLNNEMICGGVTGVGIILNHYVDLNISLVVGIMNVFLFLIGLVMLGKKFALSTLVSAISFPILLEFFNTYQFFNGYVEDVLLASILGGSLLGIGTGLMIRSGGSSGGMDIIAIILNKKFGLPVFIFVNSFDFIVLCIQASFSNPTIIIYSIILIFITSFMLDKTLTKGSKMIQLMIISDFHDEIKKMIIEEADAGVTALYSQKGYLELDTKTLITIIPPIKLAKIKERIKMIDPEAFMVVATVDEVSGRGYSFERRQEIN